MTNRAAATRAGAARDAYRGYCDAVDRAVAVAGESFVAGEDAG